MAGTKFFLLIRKPKFLCTTRVQRRAHRDFSVPAVLKIIRLPEKLGARQAFQCKISPYFSLKGGWGVLPYAIGRHGFVEQGGSFLREEPRAGPCRGVKAP